MDFFWILWWIGIAITITTRITINHLTCHGYKDIEKLRKSTQILIHLLVIISIILVGGITVPKFLGIFNPILFLEYIVFAIIPAFIVYLVEFTVLGLKDVFYRWSYLCFIVVFIVSVIGWTIPIGTSNIEYNKNIEKNTETIVLQSQERQLLYFCNIPVQEISGSVSGSSSFGFGSVSGKISTSDELPYWYANENGEGKYDSAPASISTIVFIENGEKPYVQIITYRNQTKTTNHNNGQESTETNSEWTKYTFYLPEAVMQYPLN